MGNDARARETLGPYLLEVELGRGGQGVVYRAVDRRDGSTVALKLRFGRWNWFEREQFEQVAACLRHIRSPGIRRVLEVGEIEGASVVASEFADGEAWPAASASERDAWLRTVALLEGVARSLDEVHRVGVLHLDLKPANLGLSRSGEPTILDFGSARTFGRGRVAQPESGIVGGTLAYMAPEQLDPEFGELSPATDIWALGLLLFQCIEGSTPFLAVTEHALCRAILRDEPLFRAAAWRGGARRLRPVVRKCLAKTARERYSSAAEVADELARFLAGERVRAREPGPLRATLRWARRNPAAAWFAGVCSTSVVTWLAVAALTYSRLTVALDHAQLESDLRAVSYLQRAAQSDLWPETPQALGAIDRWLGEARALIARRPLHEARAEAEGLLDLPEDVQALARDHVAGLDALAGRVGVIEQRRARALRLERDSVVAHGAEWKQAIAAIADAARAPVYGGLRLVPQTGLVPLGADPSSGLHEFALVGSGAIPRRDPDTGRLDRDESTAVVFVLLPGGVARIGAERPSSRRPAGAPHVDPDAQPDESPVRDVALEPFLMGKFELTQAQWQQLEGVNPSWFRPEHSSELGATITLAHPVCGVSWAACDELARHHGLELPTEAQWEYAARAGSSSVRFDSDDRESLRGRVNCADRSQSGIWSNSRASPSGLTPAAAAWPDFDDGFPFTAPVGSFAPNRFGLHDVLGNVQELVRDAYASYSEPARAGDGLRERGLAHVRAYRGGGFPDPATNLRFSRRETVAPESGMLLGLRLARALQR